MNDSFGGDFNATQTGSGGAASEQKAEGIAPVLIKQINELEENSFKLFGMHFGIVSIAAIVRSIEPSSTKITYMLEDHTGFIEGHYWLEDGDDADNMAPDIMINNYAKVFGCVRKTNENKTLMIFRLMNIKDPNEICTHMLEVLNARYKAEEYSKETNDYFGAGTSASIGGVTGGAGNMSADQDIGCGLDKKHRSIFDAIRHHVTDEGISRKELKDKFKAVSEKEINSILDFLISEGHIYSSIDSDHFLPTE